MPSRSEDPVDLSGHGLLERCRAALPGRAPEQIDTKQIDTEQIDTKQIDSSHRTDRFSHVALRLLPGPTAAPVRSPRRLLVVDPGGTERVDRRIVRCSPVRYRAVRCPAVCRPGLSAPGGGDGSGTITFTGKVSGKMTLSSCPGGGPAQLTVDIDGEDSTYAGVIDKDDFAFVGPSSSAYTLAKGASKPQVDGQTYTVKNTELVGITNDDTVTANGSVTCP